MNALLLPMTHTSVHSWQVGYGIAIAVVLVVVALVVPILMLAHRINQQADAIDESLQDSVKHTAGLAGLATTIDHASVITAGLKRGRERLGG